MPSGRRTQSRDHCLMNDTVINIQIASVVSIYQLGIYIGYNSLDSLDDVEEIDCVEPIVRKVQKGRLAGTESFCSLHGTVPPFCDCLRRIVAGRHAVRNEYNMDPFTGIDVTCDRAAAAQDFIIRMCRYHKNSLFTVYP